MPEQSLCNTVRLPRDDSAPTFSDPSANGTLHWAPLHDSGLRERMGLIAAWVTATKPSVMVVDVSVEVALLVRLLGVPVVVMAMPGDRIDAPHNLVYQAADHILAAWPRNLYEPPWLRQYSAQDDLRRRNQSLRRSCPNAAIARPCPECTCPQRCRWFHAGLRRRKTLRRCASTTPMGIPWCGRRSVGRGSVAGSVYRRRGGLFGRSEFGRRHRRRRSTRDHHPRRAPLRRTARHGERSRTRRNRVVQHRWPDLDDWPLLIERAHAFGPDAWERWQTRGAAARAAALIERVAEARSTAATR